MKPIISYPFILVCATFLAHALVGAYPSGAPDTACDQMRPMHRTSKDNMSSPLIEPLSGGASYFTIGVNTTQVGPGDHVAVTITAKENFYFEGFLLQARSNENGTTRHGTFMDTSKDGKLVCENAVTHNSNSHKSNVTVIWMAPKTTVNDIKFVATIVKGYSEIYMQLTSATSFSVGSGVTLIPSMVIVLLMVFSAVIYN
ncbi:unnamed protein product [Lymnaea stagnalis]|uniref:Reelin domain-containing protein n=1 Tax=Lymnaea stagnalis TaxID=6523 RepID=A0AAV2IA83_LYMST